IAFKTVNLYQGRTHCPLSIVHCPLSIKLLPTRPRTDHPSKKQRISKQSIGPVPKRSEIDVVRKINDPSGANRSYLDSADIGDHFSIIRVKIATPQRIGIIHYRVAEGHWIPLKYIIIVLEHR